MQASQYHENVGNFLESLYREVVTGYSADGPQEFIPLSRPGDYLKKSRRMFRLLEEVAPQCTVSPQTVQNFYPQIFTILLQMGQGSYITKFVRNRCTDDNLPTLEGPALLKFFNNETMAREFEQRKWAICVPAFDSALLEDTYYNPDEILPITKRTKISDCGGSAIIYRIEIHPDHNRLRSRQKPESSNSFQPNTYALKVFRGSNAEIPYLKEYRAFKRIRDAQADIVGFLGAFRHGSSYNIILEYADGGDLENHFKSVIPPPTQVERRKVWNNLQRLLYAVIELQGHDRTGMEARCHRGFHQDIKPKNVLVMTCGNGCEYNRKFKLGDLNTCHFVDSNVPGEVQDADSHGTYAYAAPECYRTSELRNTRLPIDQSVDIFSLGCVWLESTVWIMRGYAALLHFRTQRAHEARNNNIGDAGEVFHRVSSLLPGVSDMCSQLQQEAQREGDSLTYSMIEMIKEMISITPRDRPSALLLRNKVEGLMRVSKTSPHTRSRGVHITRPNDRPSRSPSQEPQTPQYAQPSLPIRTTSSRSMPTFRKSSHDAPFSSPLINKSGSTFDNSTGVMQSASHGHISGINTDYGLVEEPGFIDSSSFSGSTPPRSNTVSHSFQPSGNFSPSSRTHPPKWSQSSVDYQYGMDSNDSRIQKDNRAITSGTQGQRTNSRMEHRRSSRESTTASMVEEQTTEQDDLHYSISMRNPGHPHPRNKPSRLSYTSSSYPRSPTFITMDEQDEGSEYDIGHQNYHRHEQQHRITPTRSGVEIPTCSRRELKQYIDDYKSEGSLRHFGSRRTRNARSLPYDHLLKRLDKRDHVFIFDNCNSMDPYWDEVVEQAKLLAYLVKRVDKNGLDLYATIAKDDDPNRHMCVKNTTDLVKHVARLKRSSSRDITQTLRQVLDPYLTSLRASHNSRTYLYDLYSRDVKPMTIYIFTDGIWTRDSDPSPLIKKAADTLEQTQHPYDQLGIQFIQWGDDPNGTQRLGNLDTLPLYQMEPTRDIVDTIHYDDDNIWKMLFGSIDKIFDGE